MVVFQLIWFLFVFLYLYCIRARIKIYKQPTNYSTIIVQWQQTCVEHFPWNSLSEWIYLQQVNTQREKTHLNIALRSLLAPLLCRSICYSPDFVLKYVRHLQPYTKTHSRYWQGWRQKTSKLFTCCGLNIWKSSSSFPPLSAFVCSDIWWSDETLCCLTRRRFSSC